MGDSHNFFQNIFFSIIDGVLLVSPDLKILKGNPAVEEMFGRSQDSFEGWPLSEFFPDDPELHEKVKTTFASGSSYRDAECLGFRKNSQTTFPAKLTLSPFMDTDGQATGVILVIKDMTLLKELEESSGHLDHLSNLGELALGMAHEIRNPLGSIRASAQLLKEELKSDEDRRYLEVVISEVDRINRMVERMMGFTTTPRLNSRSTNIHKVLNDILVLERESLTKNNIAVEQVYDPSLPPIEADEDQLKQVFINLIKNAVEASSKGGTIRLVTRLGSRYAVKTSQQTSPSKTILVEVIDSGEGVEEEKLKNLFTPFYTTKSKGSGLGLPISLKIVENHGGKIKVSSKKNVGTTLQVFLPIQQR